MPLAFLFDEHIPRPLWMAYLKHQAADAFTFDVVRIGDADDLPLGADDPDILLWAERENRIILTEDEHTIPTLRITSRPAITRQAFSCFEPLSEFRRSSNTWQSSPTRATPGNGKTASSTSRNRACFRSRLNK